MIGAAVEPSGSNISIDSLLVRDKKLPAAEIEGRVVVLSVHTGAYFDFNQVGTEIWRMLAEPCRVGKIFDSLSERHRVDEKTLARDVTPFLQTLLEQRLIRAVASDATI